MSNLYSETKGQEALRRWFKVQCDLSGNPPPIPAIFPDGLAPIVRLADEGERQQSSGSLSRQAADVALFL
jgi:hypothetical protein